MSRRLLYPLALLIGCTDTPDLSMEESELSAQQISNHAGVAETYSPLGSLPDLMANNAFFMSVVRPSLQVI